MKYPLVFFLFFLSLRTWGQDSTSETGRFAPYIQALNEFAKRIPQEKVYLHFDNTSYYQGDNIWFKCYIVTSAQHQLSSLSKTLYVELLNPGGEIIEKRILKIENGQCHGDFSLNQIPFYSGFYEVRAYTKYMLNFGDDVIFSRLLPVFDKPKKEGNFEEKKMLGYGRYGPAGNFTMKREAPVKEKAVNLRFFPEGGNLVQGVKSRVAFEATNDAGNPIDVSGKVMDGNRQALCSITTLNEGKGVFTYTPGDNRRKDIAEIEYSGKKYRFDLPTGLPTGMVMEIDNLTQPDSIGITLRKSADILPEMLGVTILSGGRLQDYYLARMEKDEIHFTMDRKRLPAGVSQIVLFNSNGEILCDRLIFIDKHNLLNIRAKTGKPSYSPYEAVNMDITIADRDDNPVQTTFSVSVRDGTNEVENTYSILTDLLLMSEIKGYVRNPSWYFANDGDPVETLRAASLDLLLMVQGWRRYSWKQMTGAEPFELKYYPEQGIETKGQVLSQPIIGKPSSKPNVDVDLVLYEMGKEDEKGASVVSSFVTDEQGRFNFVSDVEGRWSMILAATEKGKAKNYRIILDRLFSPAIRRYRYADLQVNIAENNNKLVADETSANHPEEDDDAFLTALTDSLAKLGINEKVYHLDEVTVTAKRKREQEIYHNRSTSVAYYDMASEMEDIYDRGKFFIGNNIHEMLMNMNENFRIRPGGNYEFLEYKGQMPLFIVDYQPIIWNAAGYFTYKSIAPSAIKSIYINENTMSACKYLIFPDLMQTCAPIVSMLGCIVFIETYPDGEIPVDAAKGIRKTWLEGYSQAKEFYSPDYSVLPPEPNDYRRTLYWNPMVIPDSTGIAKIRFYNNSRAINFNISAETVTAQGIIGILR